jgi:hypothetical protein
LSSAASFAPIESISCSRREDSRHRVERERSSPRRDSTLHLLAERRELLAGLQLLAALLETVDRRVEVLQLEDPFQSTHRSARVADAAR